MIKNEIPTKKIFSIAIPLILQQISMQTQVWVDRAMLGHVNSLYFSAIGNVLIPYNAITGMIVAICGGTTIVIAQSLGAKKKSDCKRYAECSYIGNTLFPLLAFAFFFFGSGSLFKLMGVQSPVLEYSTSYMRIVSISLLILGPVHTSNCILQGIGTTKIIMLSGIVSNVINIFLDWVLIYGKLGFPQMDIEGAACATIISNVIAAPITITYVFASKKIPFKIDLKRIVFFRWNLYKNILKVGVPTGMEFFLFNISNVIVISFLNRIDMQAAGIYTLITSLQALSVCLYMGFANAALTLVGHKIGEKDPKTAIKIGFRCLFFSLVVCTIIATLFWTTPKGILRIFTNDFALINYAAVFVMVIAFNMFPKATNIIIGFGIRGMGDTKWMAYGQIFGTVLVITLSYILIFPVGLGLMGIFITMITDESIRSIINLLRFWKGREFFFMKPFKKMY